MGCYKHYERKIRQFRERSDANEALPNVWNRNGMPAETLALSLNNFACGTFSSSTQDGRRFFFRSCFWRPASGGSPTTVKSARLVFDNLAADVKKSCGTIESIQLTTADGKNLTEWI
jgi:hypothetical protein